MWWELEKECGVMVHSENVKLIYKANDFPVFHDLDDLALTMKRVIDWKKRFNQ